ncbi:MAG: DUF4402 domain-containing protein [Lentimicrobiaceae bacterium]|nr:DUF4402 domain-containing protein [Lentimicrobiaceae bacterium]MCO5267139.1 DUF4402 domain-containing protein [Lentimicrobium sp.]
MNRILTAVLFILLVSGKAWSQAAVTGQAFAEVIAALTATETSQMNFGRFSPETNGGQIVLTPDGVRSAQGSVVLGGGLAQPGIFNITGAPDATFTIQLPNEPAYLTHQGSNKTMQVTSWESNPPAGTGTGTLNGGEEIVSIGATLMVGSIEDNPVGMYTGTFSLTFAYN